MQNIQNHIYKLSLFFFFLFFSFSEVYAHVLFLHPWRNIYSRDVKRIPKKKREKKHTEEALQWALFFQKWKSRSNADANSLFHPPQKQKRGKNLQSGQQKVKHQNDNCNWVSQLLWREVDASATACAHTLSRAFTSRGSSPEFHKWEAPLDVM